MEETIEKYTAEYKPEIWRAYSPEELASWVGLFAKRATMRTSKEKAISDLQDAQNYLVFLVRKIEGS